MDKLTRKTYLLLICFTMSTIEFLLEVSGNPSDLLNNMSEDERHVIIIKILDNKITIDFYILENIITLPIKIVEMAIRNGLKFNKYTVITAIEANNVALVDLLLANQNTDDLVTSTFRSCIQQNNLEIIKLFHKYGANFELKSKYCGILLVATKQNIEIIEFYLELGVDITNDSHLMLK